ncbi:hypothetical protein HYPSUDRAFT_47226 [Hypholoma sublateritium FD-334 SS-4]|uniref:Transcription initiation factor TFIID subunit 11 n=1 Tax=Hypholoma sublateritium (strain FD-334 SS-4) TaxID=945553 RepID=A0A0D2NBU5_HYPSF|nr:hypothetical protein HYPSUDRAFT_47226 [Hypholoma sublateritium FD-334 SS-4]
MTTPYYTPYSGQSTFSINPTNSQPQTSTGSNPGTPTPAGRGRPRGTATGAKRGRKAKAALAGSTSPRASSSTFAAGSPAQTPATFATSSANAQYPRVHWAMPNTSSGGADEGAEDAGSLDAGGAADGGDGDPMLQQQDEQLDVKAPVIDPALIGLGGSGGPTGSRRGTPLPDFATGLTLPNRSTPQPALPSVRPGIPGVDEEAEGDDELLPAMADDDYSAQLSWQSQSKDNLKVLMDNLSPAQYDRFEAYRRHALPKQAVRKVIQQTLGQQVSQPVAQIIAGFSKVFVGEIVEKARAVQTRRGDTGPLSPDHLREAYRAYQEESGHVGAARPLRAKKLFVR